MSDEQIAKTRSQLEIAKTFLETLVEISTEQMHQMHALQKELATGLSLPPEHTKPKVDKINAISTRMLVLGGLVDRETNTVKKLQEILRQLVEDN